MRDLIFLTRDQTHSSLQWKPVLLTGLPGKSLIVQHLDTVLGLHLYFALGPAIVKKSLGLRELFYFLFFLYFNFILFLNFT